MASTAPQPSPDGVDSAAEPIDGDESGPERRCIVTGAVGPKAALIRFVVGPGDAVVPDISERLPGRGLWLTASRAMVRTAVTKRSFAKAARRSVEIPADLPEIVERLLAQRCIDLIGMARRAGLAVAGFEKVREAQRAGRAGLLVEACDGAQAAARRDRPSEPGGPRRVEALTAAEIGQAFGRDHIVHAALGIGGIADRLMQEATRLAGFRTGSRDERTAPDGPADETKLQRQRRDMDDGTEPR